jgi:uncharacterized protein YbjT (DUF2867 family)
MRIAVFGISGRTGRALLATAQERGIDLVALARPTTTVPGASHLRVREGALGHPAVVQEVVANTDGVVSVLGPRPPFRAAAHPAVAADRAEQEALVRACALHWTVVKPPRLTDRPLRRPVAAGPTLSVGLLSSVGRPALAAFLLDEVERPRFIGQAVYVRG